MLFSDPALCLIRWTSSRRSSWRCLQFLCVGRWPLGAGIWRCRGVALFRRRFVTSELVVDGLRQGRDCRGRAKLEQPIADFFGLHGNCIELPPTKGYLQLHNLREVASACQTLGQVET